MNPYRCVPSGYCVVSGWPGWRENSTPVSHPWGCCLRPLLLWCSLARGQTYILMSTNELVCWRPFQPCKRSLSAIKEGRADQNDSQRDSSLAATRDRDRRVEALASRSDLSDMCSASSVAITGTHYPADSTRVFSTSYICPAQAKTRTYLTR